MGGAHRWQKLCQHLSEEHSCHVIAPPPTVPVGEFDRMDRLRGRHKVDGVSVTRLWTYQPTDNWSGLGRMLNYAIFAIHATLYVMLNFWRYDVVITLIGPHTTLLPGLVAKLLRRYWIVDIYDFWLDNAVDMGFVAETNPSYRLLSSLERVSLQRCDHILVLTPTLAQQYRKKYDLEDGRFTPIPFGIDRELFSPDSASSSENRIIYTGKLGHAQAFQPFFEGFARLDSKHELLVVGFGERREELEQLASELEIENKVSFRGAVPREQIPELVASSTISWVPLETDLQLDYARPTKFVETMAVGTPYVASQLREIEAVTAESGAGKAVPNNPDAISEAMSSILEDIELRREMEQNGPVFIEAEHDWTVLGSEVENVITTIVNDNT